MLKIMSDLNQIQRFDFAAPSTTVLTSGFQGQWVALGASQVSYPTSGQGGVFQIWTEGNRDGTNGFTPDTANTGKLTLLYGKYRARTDRFNGTLADYSIGTALTVGADGDLTPATYVTATGLTAGTSVSATADKIVGYCIGEGSMTYFQHSGGGLFDYIEFVTV
jgi:hypothetical protein